MRYEIVKVGAHNPSRVRAYVSEEAADRDKDRPTTELPTGDHGLVLDVVLEKEWELDPKVITEIHPSDLVVRTTAYTTVYFDFRPLEE